MPQFRSKYMGILLSPCIKYRVFFHTGGSYCTICTLCTVLDRQTIPSKIVPKMYLVPATVSAPENCTPKIVPKMYLVILSQNVPLPTPVQQSHDTLVFKNCTQNEHCGPISECTFVTSLNLVMEF